MGIDGEGLSARPPKRDEDAMAAACLTVSFRASRFHDCCASGFR